MNIHQSRSIMGKNDSVQAGAIFYGFFCTLQPDQHLFRAASGSPAWVSRVSVIWSWPYSSGRAAAGTCRPCQRRTRIRRSTGRAGRSPWQRTSSPQSPRKGVKVGLICKGTDSGPMTFNMGTDTVFQAMSTGT